MPENLQLPEGNQVKIALQRSWDFHLPRFPDLLDGLVTEKVLKEKNARYLMQLDIINAWLKKNLGSLLL